MPDRLAAYVFVAGFSLLVYTTARVFGWGRCLKCTRLCTPWLALCRPCAR